MGIYEELGVRPFINTGGWTYTRYGGSIMAEPVLAAMTEASQHFVNLIDLQNRIGEAIAVMTQNGAAYVSCGAASGILLAVATCIAGTDADLAARLPDTHGMRNEIIMARYDRGTEADPAVRAAGGKIVDVGPAGGPANAADYEAAINEHTAAILLIAFESERELNGGPIVEAAHGRDIPVLVDGAYALPPKENLWHYTRDLGVDALVTSGGKVIRGPQSTGLVLGRRELIAGCKFHGAPNLRIGRGMKVGKEEFAGIYTALKLFLARDFVAQAARELCQINCIASAINDLPHLKLQIVEDRQLDIDVDPAHFATTAEVAANALLKSDPSILLLGRGNRLTIRASQLQDGEDAIVAARLRQFLLDHQVDK